jgi:NlpC/P60 family putative phage cell wall peptidase
MSMDDIEASARARVVAAARRWLSTPYHDGAMVHGHGVDCAMLARAVYAEAGVIPPIPIEPYSPQWYLHRSEEKYLAYVLDYSREIPEAEAQPGDIVLYQYGRCFSHGAIIVDPAWPSIIHAYKQARCVTLGEGKGGDLAVRLRRFFTFKNWVSDDGQLALR